MYISNYCEILIQNINLNPLLFFFKLQQVMESLEHAMKRGAPIVAEYLGGAVNCDAYHMTDPRADGLGVSSCIRQSLQDAGVAPEEVIKTFHQP
jgi:hypothetical protein